jgi:uncharacterized lipoprotein YddW (UPF0748 family)
MIPVCVLKSLKLMTLVSVISVATASWAWAQDISFRAAINLSAVAAKATPIERRVMFDEAITWATSKQAADQILDRLKTAGFNVYVPCVWHGRGTFYPSSLNKADPRLAKTVATGEDMLAYLIGRAHAMGIQVHPWFVVARREDNMFPEFAEAGTPAGIYNVHNPKFRAFIHDIMIDVVKRYDVDGVNLDYIRSGGFCLSEFCVDDYRKKFDRSLQADLLLRKIPGYRIDSLRKWNQGALNEIVRNFSAEAKHIRPNLIVSVDAVPMAPSWEIQGQDSIAWANNEWVDVIFNMDYGRKLEAERGLKARSALNDPAKLTMLVSLFDMIEGSPVARDPSLLIDYIEFSNKKFAGSGIAFYHMPRLSDEQLQALRTGPFKQSAYAFKPLDANPKLGALQ